MEVTQDPAAVEGAEVKYICIKGTKKVPQYMFPCCCTVQVL
jgi:hypothetical protein